MPCKIKPSTISTNTIKSNAEQKIYHKIKSLTDAQCKDWIVYYSYKYRKIDLYTSLQRQNDFEIDFLFLIPNNGVYLLEVKGGGIYREDGELYTINNKKKSHKIDPITQARDNYHVLKTILKTGYNYDLDEFNYHYILAFPDIDTVESLGLELDADEIITNTTDLYNFFINLNNKYKNTYNKPFTIEDKNNLCEILNGKDFTFEMTESELVFKTNQIIEKNTEEMLEVYKTILYENPRCMVTGIAGSGKTHLAVDMYKHEIKCGRKPLMLVFNRLLCDDLNNKNENSCHLFYSFIDSIYSKYNESLKEDMLFMEKKKYWFNFIENTPFNLDYDTLIIDEAQDIEYHEDIITFINSCIKGGLEDGRWYIFYDTRQKVFVKNEKKTFYEKHKFDQYRPTRLTLNKNIRNNETIADLINKYPKYLSVDKRIKFDELLKSPSGVGYYKDDNIDNVFNKIVELIDRLTKNSTYKYRQITILNNKFDSNILSKLKNKYGSNLKEYTYGSKTMTYSTLRRFKGLDNDVIIYLHDGQNTGIEDDYVVLSRAKFRFYVFDCVEKEKTSFRYELKEGCIIDSTYKMERTISILDNLINYDFRSRITDNNYYKGLEIFENNKVKELIISNKEIKTIVHGTKDYNVSIYRDGVNTCFKCSCPFIEQHPDVPCKHMVSLMIKIYKNVLDKSNLL